jgi:hypothetical protein
MFPTIDCPWRIDIVASFGRNVQCCIGENAEWGFSVGTVPRNRYFRARPHQRGPRKVLFSKPDRNLDVDVALDRI